MKDWLKTITSYRTSLNIPKTLGNILLAALILILLSRAAAFASGEEPVTPISVVSSESMEPTMNVGDIVFWTPAGTDSIREGDIVVFRSTVHGGETVSHRVIEVREINGRIELITQGDANDRPNPSPVTESNLLGRVISIGDLPFVIPFIGHLWLGMSGFIGATLGTMGAGGLVMMVPLATVGVMLIVTILFLPEKKDDEESRLKQLILGDEEDKIHPLKVFLVLLIAFSLIIITPSVYSGEEQTIAVGVGEEAEPADEQFSYVRPGQTIYGNHSMTNFGLMRTNIYVYNEAKQDWLSIEENYLTVEGGESARVGFMITIPEHTESGNYMFNLRSHYSPFWSLYPDYFVLNSLEENPRQGALGLNLLTVLLFSTLSMGAMMATSYAYDEFILWKRYYEVKNSKKKHPKTARIKALYKKYTDWLRGVDVVDLIAVPLSLFGADLWILLLTVPLSSITAYLLGCRWRGEHYTAALTASGITIGAVYMIPLLQISADLSILLLGLTVVIVLLIIL